VSRGAQASELEVHRAALTGHCYRLLGSICEADDAVQETMLRAFRALDGFDARSSLRTWLVSIATRVCLDALAERKRRARPFEEGPAGTIDDELVAAPRTHWLEPVPDARALPVDELEPGKLAVLRESVRLAFVAALQHLPPKQRAALLLADVLDWSTAEIAGALELTPAAVNSALQRARASAAQRGALFTGGDGMLTEGQRAMVGRFVEAFERYDVEALAGLCRDDVTFSMPPFSLWLRGTASVRGWLTGRGAACRGSRLVETSASGSPAYGQYKRHVADDGRVRYQAWGLGVLELDGERVERWTTFLDVEALFPRFGLPLELPD
jgi:RNA polymerase sigma-70 factor (ECF subfamily)